MPYDKLQLNIPLPQGETALSTAVDRQQINTGLYKIYDNQKIATILVSGGIKVFSQGKAQLDKKGSSTKYLRNYSYGVKSISLTFKELSAIFVDKMITANFSSMSAELLDDPLLLVELLTKDPSKKVLLSPRALNSIDSYSIAKLIEQRRMIMNNLLDLIKGKPAADGGVFKATYTEFKLFAEILTNQTGIKKDNGALFRLDDLKSYQRYYEFGEYDFVKELPYLIRAIISNNKELNSRQIRHLMLYKWRVIKVSLKENLLFLADEILEILDQLNISPIVLIAPQISTPIDTYSEHQNIKCIAQTSIYSRDHKPTSSLFFSSRTTKEDLAFILEDIIAAFKLDPSHVSSLKTGICKSIEIHTPNIIFAKNISNTIRTVLESQSKREGGYGGLIRVEFETYVEVSFDALTDLEAYIKAYHLNCVNSGGRGIINLNL